MTQVSTSTVLKDEGNKAFADGDWDHALSCYGEALHLIELDTTEKAVLFKNRAAVYLKLCDYEAAVRECTACLEICPNDPKALFRRCQAYEALEKFEEAYKDVRAVHNLDKNNKAIGPFLQRLHTIVQDRMAKFAQTSTKAKQMMDIAFDFGAAAEKRDTATSNLLVLAKERAGAEALFKEGILQKIGSLIKLEKNCDVITNCIRIVGAIAKQNVDKVGSHFINFIWSGLTDIFFSISLP